MYSAQITRHNPTCIVLLLDQSRSMLDSIGNTRKADFVADTVNHTLHDLVIRCTKTEEVRDYYHVACLGYSGRGVASAFTGALANRRLTPVSQIAEYPARIETRFKRVPDGAGGVVEQPVRLPVWIDPVADGGTPMCQAFAEARNIIAEWTTTHARSFPPIVLHLTDGESSDGDPTALAGEIMQLATADGNALVFNCHISSRRTNKIEYPATADRLPDQFAHTMFAMSSVLPENFRNAAIQLGARVEENSRGFVCNADPSAIVQFYEIGTSLTGMAPHRWMDESV